MLRRDFRSIGTMYEMLGSWSYHRILRATASLAFLLFFAFFRENVTSSVVEVVGRLRFDEPLQGFVRTLISKVDSWKRAESKLSSSLLPLPTLRRSTAGWCSLWSHPM